MARPHILFIANEVLGWATYANQFSKALEKRNDIKATILRRSPPKISMQFMRRHADTRLTRPLRLCDPITLHSGWMGHDIRRAVQLHRPDVIHFAAHWPGAAIAKMPITTPFTLALDAVRPTIHRDLGLIGWTPAECEIESQLCKRAAHIFPMSNWAANSLIQDFDIPPNKISVTPPSLDRDQWPAASSVANAVPQILFIGNNLKRKGAERLAQWVDGPLAGRCHLHIVSSDKRQPPTGRNITFHGRVPHERLLSELVPNMDIFCLPTRLDMSPFVLVEAAAAGLPAVASNIGGISDMIENGKSGYIVAPSDDAGFIKALSDLIDNPDLRKRMGNRARTIAQDRFDGRKNFDIDIDRLVEIANQATVLK